MKRILKIFFPNGSRGFNTLRKVAIILRLMPPIPPHELNYSRWADRIEPLSWSPYKELKYQPLISLVVPVFNPQKRHFLSMVYSVVDQTYGNWQLVLVNACSDKKMRESTEDAALIDKRIKVVNITENLGIAQNTNVGINNTDGEYVGFLDHDDVMAAQALYEVAIVLQNKKAQLIYSDEDKITSNSEYRLDPHFKPDWSPQLMKETNYLNHFTVVEKKLLERIGCYRKGFDGAQDYDLFLRLIDEGPDIVHIPKILYHWRTAANSTAHNFSSKKNVLDAGVKALQNHLERNKQKGKVIPLSNQPGFYRIKYESDPRARISVFLLPSHLTAEYRKFLFSFIIDIGNTKQEVDIFAQKLKIPLKVIPANVRIHYIDERNKKIFINTALKANTNDLCLVMGSAIFLKTRSLLSQNWLTELSGLMIQVRSVVIAIPFILSSDRKIIYDAGYVRLKDQFIPLFCGYENGQHTVFGNSDWARNIDAVSGRCFMIRSKLLEDNLDYIQENGFLFFNEKFFDKLQRDNNHQVVSWPFASIVFGGEMSFRDYKSKHFSSNLSITRVEFSTFEAIRFERDYRDE